MDALFKSYYKYAPGYRENMNIVEKKLISEFKDTATQTETTEGEKKRVMTCGIVSTKRGRQYVCLRK